MFLLQIPRKISVPRVAPFEVKISRKKNSSSSDGKVFLSVYDFHIKARSRVMSCATVRGHKKRILTRVRPSSGTARLY
jgi:hypothetical protein